MSGEEDEDADEHEAPKSGGHTNGASNGASKVGSGLELVRPALDWAAPSVPTAITDLAEACVGFVERALGVRPDYTPETLPLLDHYIDMTRKTARERPEAVEVVVQAAGAYLGEVVRRRYACWWRLENDTASTRIEFRDLFLSFSPNDMVRDALAVDPDAETDPSMTLDLASFELDESDRDAVLLRLAELPLVPIDEYYAPSTRIEVLDIVIDAVRSRRLTAGDPELSLEPEDYR